MTDLIRAALERAARESELSAIALRQGDFEGFAKRAQNEAHAARAAHAAKPPLTDEQIRDLAEFDFSFDRFNQVYQDKNETLTWECSDSDLIQFARFLISGGQKVMTEQVDQLANRQAWIEAQAPLAEHQGDGPAVPESREPASVTGNSSEDGLTPEPGEEPSDEELDLVIIAIQALTPHQLDETTHDLHAVDRGREILRQSLARWGSQPARLRNCPTHGQQPPEAWGCPDCVRELREELAAVSSAEPTPPTEGEVAELVAQLTSRHYGPGALDRAAELLQQLASPPCLVLKPSPEALAALKAAGPGRIELLPDDAQIIEPSHRNLLVPAPTPVPVSDPPGPKDCDAEGKCWLSTTETEPGWVLDYPERCTNWTHWLPAHALPMPQGEVEP